MYCAETELFSGPLIHYLQNRGWGLLESEPDIAVLRKMINNQEEEIVLPKDRTYTDYHQRVKEAIRFLAKCECISEKEIIENLLPQKWDILKIRITGDKIGSGNIPYLAKGIVEEGVRRVLLASARYVLSSKSYFKRLYSSEVEQWMRKCRAGSAESGSYILTVQMPLQEDEIDSEVPFSRRVSEYLMTSLGRLATLCEEPEAFGEDSELHLNANVCLALAEMKPDETPIHFGFEMKWSPDIPVKKTVPSKVEIRDHYLSSITHIGEKLIPKTKENQDVFVGKVLTLHGEADEHGRMQGEATLVLLIDEQQVRAKVLFDSSLYPQVCDAHKQNQYIRISGVLSEKPRCSELRDASDFKIIK